MSPPRIIKVMVNHHFGKFADVWKHLALTEVLFTERPAHYGESHAGSAVNPMVDDPERAFGVVRFLEATGRVHELATSRYRVILEQFGNARAWYPGSPALAMTELGNECRYLFCDQDLESTADLRTWASEAGIRDFEVLPGDGVAGIASWLAGLREGDAALVHIDPFDPHDRAPNGRSAIELAAEVAEAGHPLVYWYGYDVPSQARWPYRALERATPAALWCGDVMVLDEEGEPGNTPGDLGEATTPGTGSGILLANVSPTTRAACQRLGRALEVAYAGATLPDHSPGRIRFGSCGAISE